MLVVSRRALSVNDGVGSPSLPELDGAFALCEVRSKLSPVPCLCGFSGSREVPQPRPSHRAHTVDSMSSRQRSRSTRTNPDRQARREAGCKDSRATLHLAPPEIELLDADGQASATDLMTTLLVQVWKRDAASSDGRSAGDDATSESADEPVTVRARDTNRGGAKNDDD